MVWMGSRKSMEPVEDKAVYEMAKAFAQSVGKDEVQVKHGSEDTKEASPY